MWKNSGAQKKLEKDFEIETNYLLSIRPQYTGKQVVPNCKYLKQCSMTRSIIPLTSNFTIQSQDYTLPTNNLRSIKLAKDIVPQCKYLKQSSVGPSIIPHVQNAQDLDKAAVNWSVNWILLGLWLLQLSTAGVKTLYLANRKALSTKLKKLPGHFSCSHIYRNCSPQTTKEF